MTYETIACLICGRIGRKSCMLTNQDVPSEGFCPCRWQVCCEVLVNAEVKHLCPLCSS